MLIYHPAFDVYHCVFRMLAVSECVSSLEIDKARLLDFYLLFPAAVASIRLPNVLRDARKLANSAANIYHDPLSVSTTFMEMRPIQEAALKCIAASELLDIQNFENGIVSRTKVTLPDPLKRKVEEFLIERRPLADIILNELSVIPLLGADGLKHRTQLMEYKYDVA